MMIDKLESLDEFYDGLVNFSRGKVKNEDDIKRLIELAIKENKLNDLEEIAFSAKITKGLLRIIQNRENTIEDEYFEKIKKEYSENIQKVKIGLEELINHGSDFIKNIFNEKYFLLTHESLANLNNLCGDLEWVKMYLNDIKR